MLAPSGEPFGQVVGVEAVRGSVVVDENYGRLHRAIPRGARDERAARDHAQRR